MRLGKKLLLLFSLTSLFIVAVFSGVVYHRLRSQQLALIQESIAQQLYGFDFSLKSFFDVVEGDVLSLARNPDVRTQDDTDFTNFLHANEKSFAYDYSNDELRIIALFNIHRQSHSYVSSVYMGRENGAFVRSHPREKPTQYDPRTRPWYRLAKERPDEVIRTDAYPSLTSPDVNVGIVKALVDETGKFYGAVGIDFTLARLTKYLLDFRITPSGKVSLIDRNGVILATHDESTLGRKFAENYPSFAAMLESDGLDLVEMEGIDYFFFHRRCFEENWRLAVFVPVADLEKPIFGMVLWTVLSLSLALFTLSMLTIFILRSIVIKPLSKLTQEIDHIAKTGDLELNINIVAHGEIGDLVNSHNKMLQKLANSQRSLWETKQDLMVYRDNLEVLVSERTRQLESTMQDLEVAVDRAETADRLKSSFLATMSHELRTPLNSIIGFNGIILQELSGPVNDEQKKQLKIVRGSARHLLSLINDLLDISKIESGQMTVQIAPFNMLSSMEKVIETIKPLADKKNIYLQTHFALATDTLTSDQRGFEQILINLLSNAIKFTKHGGVTIQAETVAVSNGDSAVKISVIDTGIGIKEEDIDIIFKPFRQICTGLSRQHEGTGLGLAICMKMSALLGGRITVQSEWGKGSTFVLTIPLI